MAQIANIGDLRLVPAKAPPMTQPKPPPPWRRAFLRVLARCGSVALAAEHCGIDRTSAYQYRKRNPAFAASWDRALATARARLNGAAPDRPAAQPRPRNDLFLRSSKTGRVCVARAGPGRWSARAEAAFLTELAASANVAAAARAAGVSAQAVYQRRRLWPEFARAWRAALAEGYDRLEAHLLHAATATLDPEPPDVPSEAPAMSIDQAMNLLKLHRAEARGGAAQRYGWRQVEPDIEEVDAEILRRVQALERGKQPKPIIRLLEHSTNIYILWLIRHSRFLSANRAATRFEGAPP